MPLIKTTKVKIGKDERPGVETSFVTGVELDTLIQSQMRLKAQRSHAGTVFTLVSKDLVIVTEILVKRFLQKLPKIW